MERAADTTSRFALLVISERPAILTFFEAISWRVDAGVSIVHAMPTADAVDEQLAEPPAVAVVDVAPDSARGVELCRRVAERGSEVPIVALLCCPFCVTPGGMSALLEAGVSGLLDLRATPREALRILGAVADGESVLHIRLGEGRRTLLRDALSGREPRNEVQRRLLELVALGLPDHEIGKRLHLSPHTVKHHVEDLRRVIGARNRTELAAWAGRNGFYAENARAS